jgi:hypothetical protein
VRRGEAAAARGDLRVLVRQLELERCERHLDKE